MDDLAYLPATKLLKIIQNRKISIVDVMTAYISRIKKYNPQIMAICDMRTEEDLMKEAAEKDRMLADGQVMGKLHGLPMTIKDGFLVKGLLITNGHPAYRKNIATEDAVLVKRLKAAGAIIIGKTNLPLFSIDWQSTNSWYGQTNNPYDQSRVPGGSSGGSAAALSMGFSPLELGSDAGGSIRIPSHFCGVCGIRPTEQALSNRGNFKFNGKAQGQRIITVAGPMARNVEDLLLAMSVLWDHTKILAEIPPVDFNSSQWKGEKLKVAYSETMYDLEIDAECQELTRKFLERIATGGHQLSEDKPNYDAERAYALNGVFLGHEIDANTSMPGWFTKIMMYIFLLIKYRDRVWAKSVFNGINISAAKLSKALEDKDKIGDQFIKFFDLYDIWITPTASIPAFKHQKAGKPFDVNGKKVGYTDAMGRFAFDTALGGHPIVVIPIGNTKAGLPVGISIHGKKWHDKRLLEIARYLQQFTPGFTKPPQLI